MDSTFCFHCELFVEVLGDKHLSCGHTIADQQTKYGYLIEKTDNALKEIFAEFNLPISDRDRKIKAFQMTIDLLGKAYSE